MVKYRDIQFCRTIEFREIYIHLNLVREEIEVAFEALWSFPLKFEKERLNFDTNFLINFDIEIDYRKGKKDHLVQGMIDW